MSHRKEDILIIQNNIFQTDAGGQYPFTQFICCKSILCEWKADETGEAEKNSASRQEAESFLDGFHTFRPFYTARLKERGKEIPKIQKETIHYLLDLLLCKQENSRAKTLHCFYYSKERETTCFTTTGTVITADKREHSFNVHLEMSQAFTSMASKQIDFKEPCLLEPLVIHLHTNVANISDQKFFFDLDTAGAKEELPRHSPDSSPLSLDKNRNGFLNHRRKQFSTNGSNGVYDLL